MLRETRPRTREGVKLLPAQYLDVTTGVVTGVNIFARSMGAASLLK